MQVPSNITCSVFILLKNIRIESFNPYRYGSKKASSATSTYLVTKILNNFDLVIIQEITDVKIKAPYVYTMG